MAGFHEISTYNFRYRSSKVTTNWGGFIFKNHGMLICDGDSTKDRLIITIAPDDEPLHAGETVTMGTGSDAQDVGFIAIRRADIGIFIDLLRNEKPVYMQIHEGTHGVFNRILTGAEPVGEGEEEIL